MKVDGDEHRRIVVLDFPYTHVGRKCLRNSGKLDSCPILDMRIDSVTLVLQFCLARMKHSRSCVNVDAYHALACYGGCFLVSYMMRAACAFCLQRCRPLTVSLTHSFGRAYGS